MTREEVVNSKEYKSMNAALDKWRSYEDDVRDELDYTDGFQDGAEWMEKEMMVKMKNWLEREYAYNGSMACVTPDFIDDFIKAMEEI